MCATYKIIFLANTEQQLKHKEIQQKNSWFENTFLDSEMNLKEEIHEKLNR